MSNVKSIDLSDLAENWPAPIVARDKVERFSGGVMTSKYLANLDSRGLGPPGRFYLGRKCVYPVASLVEWLEARAETVK